MALRVRLDEQYGAATDSPSYRRSAQGRDEVGQVVSVDEVGGTAAADQRQPCRRVTIAQFCRIFGTSSYD
jgi:hypothetical protein